MKSYILKPKSIRREYFKKKSFGLSASCFRFVKCKNKKFLKLENLIYENKKGFEPGSKEYINFSKNYFIRISELNDLSFLFNISIDTKKIKPVLNLNLKDKIIKKGDICYQTASNVGNVCIYNGENKSYYNSHIRKLSFKNKYYIFAILKSRFGKNQVAVAGSIKGIDNFREEYLLNTKIPFPTNKNNRNPQQVENLISLITQNIISKEKQIEIKNNQINKLIEKELKENQKNNSFSYKFPRISDIRKELRFDTGLYEKDFQEDKFLIENYTYGFSFLDKGEILGGNTPKKRIFNKGNLWLTPTDCKKGVLKNKSKIKTLKYNLDEDSIVIVNRSNVAETVLFKKDIFKIGHHNQGMYRIKIGKNYEKYLFILCWFNSLSFQKLIKNIATGATFPEIRVSDLSKKSPIPNFSKLKQKEISKFYYNKFAKNDDLNFENYLEKEKARNNKIGIFQLNMEIFSLKEILENLVDKIIKEQKIEISFNY